MSVTTVRLQPEVESGLEAMAGKLHRSKNWLVNQAIREFVARQEQELKDAYAEVGLQLQVANAEEGWILMTAQKPAKSMA